MKTVLSLLALVALGASVVAQMGHHISKNAKHVITCPISGDKVDIDKATKAHLFADYKGNRYYFCCADCPPAFKKNPAKYAGKPHMPIPSQHKPDELQHRMILVSNGK